jgi:hypothetical protein
VGGGAAAVGTLMADGVSGARSEGLLDMLGDISTPTALFVRVDPVLGGLDSITIPDSHSPDSAALSNV